MVVCKTYTITTTGLSEGLVIPINFEIRICREIRREDPNDDTKYQGVWQVVTFESAGSTMILTNDAIDLKKKKPNYFNEITALDLNSGTATLIDKYVKPYLETIYPGNVT